MATKTMDYLLDTTASTERTPAKSGGKTSPPTTNLASVTIVAPMPADPELTEKYLAGTTQSAINAARRGWVAYADAGADILAGDKMTVAGVFTDAKVLAAAPWPTDNAYIEIILSE